MSDEFGMTFKVPAGEPSFERAHDYLVAAAARWEAEGEEEGPDCLLAVMDEYLPTNNLCGDDAHQHLADVIEDLPYLTLQLEQAKVIYEHTHPGAYYVDDGATLVATRTADKAGRASFATAPNTGADATFEKLWNIGALGAAGFSRS